MRDEGHTIFGTLTVEPHSRSPRACVSSKDDLFSPAGEAWSPSLGRDGWPRVCFDFGFVWFSRLDEVGELRKWD